MASRTAEDLLADRRNNATVSWVLLAFLAAIATESFVTGDLAWSVFVASVLVLCVLPPLAFRDAEV
jgi:hypothetical protein